MGLYLQEDTVMRRESFGGLLYHRSTGTTIDLDREAYTLIEYIKEYPGIDKKTLYREFTTHHTSIDIIIEELLSFHFLKEGKTVERSIKKIQIPWSHHPHPHPHLQGPETVHWALTYDCHQSCPDCYSQHHSYPLLKKEEYIEVLQHLSTFSIFQLSLGGGEPLLFPYIREVVEEASRLKLSVHLTTSAYDLTDRLLEDLYKGLTTLQIGINHEHLLHRPQQERERLSILVEKCKEKGLQIGANLILSTTMIEHFTQIIALLYDSGLRRITLLRYKPPPTIIRWKKENPKKEVLQRLPYLLTLLPNKFQGLQFRLDCASTFLHNHVDVNRAEREGLRGCIAGSRILALAPDASIYPCSQLVSPQHRVGDVLNDSLEVLWESSPVMKKYRTFRKKKSYRETWCGLCKAKEFCGGCRVFAFNSLGGEPNCPFPVKPPLHSLDKKGRRLSLKEYMDENFSISVEEYMGRYGVEQRRAVRELKESFHVSLQDQKSKGNNLHDMYISARVINLYEIQSSIGFTGWGFPYMTIEEIEKGLEESCEEDYPNWLLLLKRESSTHEVDEY